MTELEKLKHLLEHWIEHNDAHINTYEEWASRVRELGRQDLAAILTQIVSESKKLNVLFDSAIKKAQ